MSTALFGKPRNDPPFRQRTRAIEEFINVPLFGTLNAACNRQLLAMPLDNKFLADPRPSWLWVRTTLLPHFDSGTVQRFCQLMLQFASVGHAFRLHGISNPGFATVESAIEYLQARRRHFVSLLYMMAGTCRGNLQLVPLDTLNVLLPQVELSCITITSLYLQLALAETLPDFTLETDETGAFGSHWLETLDSGFLDPERASIVAMNEMRGDQIARPELEPVDPRKIFSAAELRNSVRFVGAAYDKFGLNEPDFATMAELVTKLSYRCNDDYGVAIGKDKLRRLMRQQKQFDDLELERLLVNQPSLDYAANTNAFEPFIDLGHVLVSTVNLLSRFIYAFKNVHLGSRRRFQIHAGFIFEDMVARDLRELGFAVTDIKRINRKEFDVVAILGGVIYNFQCKNNWIDFSKLESNRALYLRYNSMLIRYYERSLVKEEKREGLLKLELGLNDVQHFVISRFPVITVDNRIVSYNRITTLPDLIRRAQPRMDRPENPGSGLAANVG